MKTNANMQTGVFKMVTLKLMGDFMTPTSHYLYSILQLAWPCHPNFPNESQSGKAQCIVVVIRYKTNC